MREAQRCLACKRRRWRHVVFVEHDANGKPTGPFTLLCDRCMDDELDGSTPYPP